MFIEKKNISQSEQRTKHHKYVQIYDFENVNCKTKLLELEKYISLLRKRKS